MIESKPFFLITIDTEGDNLWGKPQRITTKNAQFLESFQMLCESYGFKPTYLTNYEMANSLVFQDFGKNILRQNTGEIGMHLHAWNSPPKIPLTDNDYESQPYLIEYKDNIIRKKVTFMTELLEDTFGVKMISHRAGRWSFDERYARILAEQGYRVDCSVTPFVSWKKTRGGFSGGTDFSNFNDKPYFLDLINIKKSGYSSLLEIPMTIIPKHKTIKRALNRVSNNSFYRRVINHFLPNRWLQPNGKNLTDMLQVLKAAIKEGRSYVQFTLHSSELMPGGSPLFPNNEDIERLYEDLDTLFEIASQDFTGATLGEYYRWFVGVKA